MNENKLENLLDQRLAELQAELKRLKRARRTQRARSARRSLTYRDYPLTGG